LRAALKHPTLAIAFAVAAVLGSAQAAIPVGPSGSGTITFDANPAPTEWATVASIPGNGGTAVDLTGLDTLVKTLAASGITAFMGEVTTDPVGTTTQDGKWNSTALRLTSRAGTSAATCFMATLANTSGAAINELDINFTLSGSAPAGEDTGMAGYALYYSLTGAAATWQRIGVYGTPGAVSVTNIPLSGPWSDAANLYVLWVDDNGNNGGDGWYGFDDVSFAKSLPAANILTFGPGATIGPVSANAAAISWTVPSGSNLAALSPTFTLSPGATCTVDGTLPVSGETRDFTNPVHYIVYSSDYVSFPPAGTFTDYTVTATTASAAPPVTTGLALHLDASAADTMTMNDTTVNEWRDKNGSATKMTTQAGTPTVVATGIGGLPTVHFTNGSSMRDGVNHSAPVTIFYVSRQTGGSNQRVLAATGNNWLLGYWGGNKNRAYFEGWVSEGGASDTNPHLYATTIGGSGQNSTVWAEGTQIASNQGGTQGPNNLDLGGGSWGEYSDCDISEVLVYNRILEPLELDLVGGYLTVKYGLTTTYPPPALTVRLTSPANGEGIPSGTSVPASANVADPGAFTHTVTFHVTPTPAGTPVETVSTSTSSPFTADLGALASGTYEIYATVLNSNSETATSATHTFTVAAATPTTTALVSTGSPTTYGDSVTFTATVSPAPSGGTVQFYANAVALGSPVSVNTGTGVANYSTTALGVATYTVTAVYSGHGIYNASTSDGLSHVVDKAGLTVTAVNMLRLPNTANPEFLYEVTGFKNGENLGSSGVGGTPALTTTAIDYSTELTDYPITCGLGSLTSTNYEFLTFVEGILTVADLADTFSVNFYAFGSVPPESQANVLMPAELPAGLGDWFTYGWRNVEVPWGGGLQPAATLTSNKGSSATFIFKDCRNGWSSWGEPRTTNLGDGNYNMMGAGVNATLDGESNKYDMEMTNIPFDTYDVIFYFRSNDAQYGDGTGVIKFNGGTERAYKMKSGAFDGNFIEMVDATTEGNYIVFTGVTGSSFTAQTWGLGAAVWGDMGDFNHNGPSGFQIREAAVATGYGTWAEINAPGQTPDQDYDNDGVENGIEYFMGETGSSFTAMPGLDGTNTVTWTKDPAYNGSWQVQTSPDLSTWTDVSGTDNGSSVSYTLTPGAGKLFVRLLVTPAP
jgi:hypothetical protein